MTTAPISHSIDYEDDRYLDDAALWAVIDSAEATHSSNKFRKPLAIRYPNFHSPPPKPPPPQNHHHYKPHFNISSLNSSPYRRPNKIARSCASSSEVSECTSSPLALIRSPVVKTGFLSSPESYLSPQIGKFGNDGLDVSSVSCVEEKDAVMNHCLNGRFPSVSLFKDYQNSAMAILEKSDFTMISGNPYIKKSGWRKMSCYFNLSYEIKDKTIEFDENRNVQRAEFVVRAHMQGGRFSDGWGSCERREKRFLKPNHDIPSTAETRAKNKACQDLLGIGEYRPGASQHHQKM